MIVQSTRIGRKGGVRYLARHLLDKFDENDRVEILAGDRAALYDAQALAEAKQCKFSVRHLSISPEREMTPVELSGFIQAINAEFRVGPDRPRIVVRHIKKGRSHFHFAIAEVDPSTFRVLDCRRDYQRLEDLARRYEAEHGEHIQPTRAARRVSKAEGFSDIARKRAERTSPAFDRTRLKLAFAGGAKAFHAELKTQGLRIANGDRGPILADASGMFVAAANRTVGVKRNEFLKFMETIRDDRLIGTQKPAPATAVDGRIQHSPAPTAPVAARNPGSARPHRSTDRTFGPVAGHAAPSGAGNEVHGGQARPYVPTIVRRRRREELFLHQLGKVDLDDLLRRAQELANWIRSIFEPKSISLSRQIMEAREKRKSFPPAEAQRPYTSSYDCRRRVTP